MEYGRYKYTEKIRRYYDNSTIIVCVIQVLNKFPELSATSFFFFCSTCSLTTVLIFAVRRITARNLFDILRAKNGEWKEEMENTVGQGGKLEK